MKKQKILAIVLTVGFLYFLGSTLYSQTTYDDHKCKCCDETCQMTDCCKNCGENSAQGTSNACCNNCSGDKCGECCAKMNNQSTPGNDAMKNCPDNKDCCKKSDPTTGSGKGCCNKK